MPAAAFVACALAQGGASLARRRAFVALSGLWLTLRAHAANEIRLRIRNDSAETFEHVWQGSPRHGTDVDLGPLAPGETSRWHALPAVLPHYRKTRVQLARRQVTGVLQGGALMPGRYTLACTLQPRDGSLRVVPTPEPAHQK